jgi:glycine/D-amino acid oxidase-like deaminating enzyme
VPGSRLTVIGGGVMGLMTACHAAPMASAVTVLERSSVGDPATASFGLTRSLRASKYSPAMELHPMFRAEVSATDAVFLGAWNA